MGFLFDDTKMTAQSAWSRVKEDTLYRLKWPWGKKSLAELKSHQYGVVKKRDVGEIINKMGKDTK